MRITSIIANLVDVYHIPISDIANLTDYQIRNIYFAPRKQDGGLDTERLERKLQKKQERQQKWAERLKVPEEAVKADYSRNEYFDAYKVLFDFQAANLISKEDFQEKIKALQAKYKHLFPEVPKVATSAPTTKATRAEIESYRLNGLIDDVAYAELMEKLQ